MSSSRREPGAVHGCVAAAVFHSKGGITSPRCQRSQKALRLQSSFIGGTATWTPKTSGALRENLLLVAEPVHPASVKATLEGRGAQNTKGREAQNQSLKRRCLHLGKQQMNPTLAKPTPMCRPSPANRLTTRSSEDAATSMRPR